MDVRPVRRMAGTQHGDVARHAGKVLVGPRNCGNRRQRLTGSSASGSSTVRVECRDRWSVHWLWRRWHQAIGRPLPFTADQDRGDPLAGARTGKANDSRRDRQRDRAVGRGILQQQRRPGLACAVVAAGVPNATVEQQRRAVLHVGLDDGRGRVDRPRQSRASGRRTGRRAARPTLPAPPAPSVPKWCEPAMNSRPDSRTVFRMPIQTEIARASGAALSTSVCHGWLVPGSRRMNCAPHRTTSSPRCGRSKAIRSGLVATS